MHPSAVCPEETPESPGPCWVRKPTQPDFGRKVPRRQYRGVTHLQLAKAKHVQTQWAWAKPVLPADTSLQKTHSGSCWSEEHRTCCSARGQSPRHRKETRSASQRGGIGWPPGCPRCQPACSVFSCLHSHNNSYCCHAPGPCGDCPGLWGRVFSSHGSPLKWVPVSPHLQRGRRSSGRLHPWLWSHC